MMKRSGNYFLFCFLALISSCFWQGCTDNQIEFPSIDFDPDLIFQTGFEESSKVVVTGTAQLEDIIGIDSSLTLPNDWEQHFDRHPNIGTFRLYYEAGNRNQRFVRITADPTDPENSALHFWLAEANVGPGNKGRIQSDVYGNNGLKEIYQSVRIYFHPHFEALKSFPERIYWLTIFELWNNPSWGDYSFPFRVSINLEKPKSNGNHDLTFRAHGQKKIVESDEWSPIWDETASHLPIPFGEWITLELYIKEGDEDNGRFYMSATFENGIQQVLFDITNYTHHPEDPSPDGFSHFNPMKLYTSGPILNFMKNEDKALQIYWDDFKLWKDRQP